MNNIAADTIKTHKMAIDELSRLDPETQAHQLRISNFFLKHRELIGISYASADLIIAEKDVRVANAAMKIVAAEMVHRGDVTAVGFRFIHRKVTENQVRQILHTERLKETPNIKTQKPQNAEIILKCPHCKKEIQYKRITRDNVVAFRVTEKTDDAIEYLSTQCSVSRSFLIDQLLKIEKRFSSVIQ